ncbi:ROK family protein, partial [Lapillicoccus sp.]|uniref:ROK family transcriptional regulator n=1 Tax=Lapillicoccus sp. TaxID=1909287 RepID=UPI0039839F01
MLDAVRQVSPTPVRIAELGALTSLTRPTVAQAVEDLLETGWLTQHAPQEDRPRGRPATRYSINGLAAPVMGIDVGAHSVTVAVADLTGHRLGLVRHTGKAEGTGKATDAAQLLVSIDAAVAEALASTGLSADRIAAVAVGSPGLIDAERGSARIAPSLPGWPEIRIVEHLAQTFDCPVLLENDANLAALAISQAMETAAPTLLAVQWGERLGSGIVLAGRLHRGALAAAGEIGFITPGGGREPLAADQRGPLEQRIGAEAIAARAREAA